MTRPRPSPETSPAGAPPRRRARLEVVRGGSDPRAVFYDRMADDLAAKAGVRVEAMQAIFRLVAAYDALHAFLAPRIAEHGLSMAAFNTICVLSQEPRGLPVSDLSGRLLVSRQNVSAVVQGLEKRKLVHRVVDPGDRRVRRIAVTAAGAALRDAILPEHLDRVGNVTRSFSSDELREFASYLSRIRAAVGGT